VEPAPLVDFAFSSQMGTGVYSVGNRTVYVLRIPVSFWIRRVEADRWGYKFLLPVSIGLVDFHPLDFLGEEFPPLKLGTLTVLPGLEWRRKLYDRWIVRPYGHIGAGKDLEGGELTWVYDLGLKSRVIFPWRKWEFSVGNKLLYAGSKPTGGSKARFFFQFDTGFDAQRLIRHTRHRKHFWSVFTIYHFYFEPLQFERVLQEEVVVRNTVEFGAAYGAEPKGKLAGFTLPNIGMSYEVGPQFWAVRISMGFPF
jgi:hypothetical protein